MGQSDFYTDRIRHIVESMVYQLEYTNKGPAKDDTQEYAWVQLEGIAKGFKELASVGIVGQEALDIFTKMGWWYGPREKSILEHSWLKGYREEKEYWKEQRRIRKERDGLVDN